jgi:penicillin-binding protein 2
VGAKDLLDTAALFNIETAKPNTEKRLNEHLPQASYGQGEVVVTPLRMARVAGAIATGGKLVPLRTRLAPPPAATDPPRVLLAPELARELERAMRGVVTSGTGREAAKGPVEIAGKTGTAELANAPAHAWFAGFAPYNRAAADRVAFAIVIEHARYGGRAAAPFAVPLAEAASRVRLSAEDAQ